MKRFTRSSIEKMESVDLTNVELCHLDFGEFFSYHESEEDTTATFFFVDPPYYLEEHSKLYGKNGDMHEDFDHRGLHHHLQTKPNWLLTYNDCEYIRQLYRLYLILDTQWSYGMNKTKRSSEIIILSRSKEGA